MAEKLGTSRRGSGLKTWPEDWAKLSILANFPANLLQ